MWTMKMLDLSFSMEAFERELHEYIIPEVVRLKLDGSARSARHC